MSIRERGLRPPFLFPKHVKSIRTDSNENPTCSNPDRTVNPDGDPHESPAYAASGKRPARHQLSGRERLLRSTRRTRRRPDCGRRRDREPYRSERLPEDGVWSGSPEEGTQVPILVGV